MQYEPVDLGETLEPFYARFAHVLFCYAHIQATYYPDVLIEAFGSIARLRSDTGLVICGLMGRRDEASWQDLQRRIARLGVSDRVLLVDDLNHEQFLTALSRSTAYVRTTPADGASSSVLEALALRVPVVAAENGSRPAGVLTYEGTSAAALAERLGEVVDGREDIAAAIPVPTIADTLEQEAQLLLA
jgi:glycosyltransferase involved in cell wall biosynthesis